MKLPMQAKGAIEASVAPFLFYAFVCDYFTLFSCSVFSLKINFLLSC